MRWHVCCNEPQASHQFNKGGVEMKRIFRENGLSIALFALFAVSLAGQYFAGWLEHNEDELQHGRPAISAADYIGEGHFWEALFENWESEFLQMSAYVLLTVWLFQKGSSESKRPETVERVDHLAPKKWRSEDTPWPVRKGGWVLKIYENSLSIALLLLFIISFVFHGVAGAVEYNAQQAEHGEALVSTAGFMMTSQFWFESFQNWQSEFL